MNREDRLARREIRWRDVDVAIEATRAQERRIDEVHPVRRRDDRDVVELLEPVHLGEDLGNDALGDLGVLGTAADRCDRIDFVEEDDARRRSLRFPERFPDHPLRFTDPLAHELGTADRDEVRLGFRGDCLREECFSGPGRAKDQDSPRRAGVEVGEHFVHPQGPLDRFTQFLFRLVEAADVVPLDVRLLDEDLPQGRRLHLPVCLEKVVPGHRELVQHLGRDHVRLEIDVGQDPSEGAHRGFLRERREVRADVAVGQSREFLQLDIL